jgi:hypothetical protein
METAADLLNRGLPKWPQMVVTGERVDMKQAKEIIRRTDSFFTCGYGGNDQDFDAEIANLLKIPHVNTYGDKKNPYAQHEGESFHDFWERCDKWKADWGCLETQYVRNSWISSSFVGGPSGWCHPTGRIGHVDNVGKWPSCEDVRDDWKIIAEAFPFLKVGVTLHSGESCEDGIEPVCSLMVEAGTVIPVNPANVNVHEGHEEAQRAPGRSGLDMEADLYLLMTKNPNEREHGLSSQWLLDYAIGTK